MNEMRKPPIQANKTVDKKKVPKKIILGNKIRKRVLKQLTLGKTYRLMMLRMRRKLISKMGLLSGFFIPMKMAPALNIYLFSLVYG